MRFPEIDDKYLTGVFVALILATVAANIGLIWSIFSLPTP
jgi:hypothetical protein